MVPGFDEPIRRIPALRRNDLSVVLRVETEHFSLLLGADLEKRGWAAILENMAGQSDKASVFKVPHHGSKSAHHPEVWRRLLEPNPVAVLAPWQRAGRVIPSARDVELILSHTEEAYITNMRPTSGRTAARTVDQTNAQFSAIQTPCASRQSGSPAETDRTRVVVDGKYFWKCLPHQRFCNIGIVLEPRNAG